MEYGIGEVQGDQLTVRKFLFGHAAYGQVVADNEYRGEKDNYPAD